MGISYRKEEALQNRTLLELIQMGVKRFYVACRACQKNGEVDIQTVVQRVSLDKKFKDMRFKCKRCGRGMSRAIPD